MWFGLWRKELKEKEARQDSSLTTRLRSIQEGPAAKVRRATKELFYARSFMMNESGSLNANE
jgi:hypothetical protein